MIKNAITEVVIGTEDLNFREDHGLTCDQLVAQTST